VASVSGTADWTFHAGIFTAPEAARVVRFHIYMLSGNPEGEVWIDDNRLVERE
jgi:hypothetical protein